MCHNHKTIELKKLFSSLQVSPVYTKEVSDSGSQTLVLQSHLALFSWQVFPCLLIVTQYHCFKNLTTAACATYAGDTPEIIPYFMHVQIFQLFARPTVNTTVCLEKSVSYCQTSMLDKMFFFFLFLTSF